MSSACWNIHVPPMGGTLESHREKVSERSFLRQRNDKPTRTKRHTEREREGSLAARPPSSLLPVQPVCTSQSSAGPSLSPSLSLGGAPSLCSAWLYCLDVYLHRVYGAFPRVCPAPCLLPMHCGFLSFTAGSFPSPLPKHPCLPPLPQKLNQLLILVHNYSHSSGISVK